MTKLIGQQRQVLATRASVDRRVAKRRAAPCVKNEVGSVTDSDLLVIPGRPKTNPRDVPEAIQDGEHIDRFVHRANDRENVREAGIWQPPLPVVGAPAVELKAASLQPPGLTLNAKEDPFARSTTKSYGSPSLKGASTG